MHEPHRRSKPFSTTKNGRVNVLAPAFQEDVSSMTTGAGVDDPSSLLSQIMGLNIDGSYLLQVLK
jgi:hypothetical protein